VDEDASEWTDRRVEAAREVYERHGRIFRWAWIAAGFVVVAVGLAMIIVPGPATVVVPFGLAMLAAVFGWARRLLIQSVEQGETATRRFREAGRPVQVLTMAASACVAGAVILWFVL
jgi:hypothetical protein